MAQALPGDGNTDATLLGIAKTLAQQMERGARSFTRAVIISGGTILFQKLYAGKIRALTFSQSRDPSTFFLVGYSAQMTYQAPAVGVYGSDSMNQYNMLTIPNAYDGCTALSIGRGNTTFVAVRTTYKDTYAGQATLVFGDYVAGATAEITADLGAVYNYANAPGYTYQLAAQTMYAREKSARVRDRTVVSHRTRAVGPGAYLITAEDIAYISSPASGSTPASVRATSIRLASLSVATTLYSGSAGPWSWVATDTTGFLGAYLVAAMYIGYYGAYYNSPSGGLGPTYYIGYSPLRPYFNDSTTAALTTGACRRLGAYGGGGTPQYNIVFSSGGIGGPIDPYILGVEGNGYSAGTALKLGYGGGYYYNLYGANYQLYQCVVSYPGALTTYVLDGGGYGGYTTPVFSWGNFPPRNGMCITGAGAGYGGHYSAGYAGVLQPAGIVYDSWGDGCGTYPYAAGGYGTNAYGHFYDVGDDDLLGNRFGVGLFNSENAPFIRADGSIYQTYIDASAQANEGGVLSPTVASYAASYAGTSSLLVRIVSPAGAVSTTAAIASGSFTGSSAGEADAALGCSHYVQAASAFIGDMSATAAGFVVYMVFDGNSTLLTAGAGIIASYYVATISADANGVYSGTPVKIATPIALSTLFKTTPYAVPWAQDNLSMSTAGAGFVWFVVSGVLFACEAATGILYSSPLAQPDGVYSVVWLGGQRVEIRSTHGTEGRYLDPAAGVIGSSGVIFRSAFSAATLGTTAPTAQFEPRGCVLPIARGDSKYLLPY